MYILFGFFLIMTMVLMDRVKSIHKEAECQKNYPSDLPSNLRDNFFSYKNIFLLRKIQTYINSNILYFYKEIFFSGR